jgi:nucleoside-diphosphate-sugar epimerase
MNSTNREIKTAVVTGPTGAIGNALCRLLISKGIYVYAVCRPETSRADTLPKDKLLTRVFCDAFDYSKLGKMISNADVFYHFSWASTVGEGRNDMHAQIANIKSTVDAVEAASDMHCKVFIGAGSQAEYGRVEGDLKPDTPVNPENGYGMAKLCAGEMSRVECRKYGIDHIWARVLSVYGPFDGNKTMIVGAITSLLKGEKPSFTAGEQKWDYLFSEDAAEAFYALAVYGVSGRIYTLGSGEARPLKDYIKIIGDSINPDLPLGLGEIPYGPNQVMYLKADVSQLFEDTGYKPHTSFEDGILKTIDWVRSSGNV